MERLLHLVRVRLVELERVCSGKQVRANQLGIKKESRATRSERKRKIRKRVCSFAFEPQKKILIEMLGSWSPLKSFHHSS